MKKIILNLIYLLTISIFVFLTYFSIFGFETSKFNTEIQKKVKNINSELSIELNKIKLILDPFKFEIGAKTLGTKLIHNNKSIDFEVIKTNISLKSLVENKFSITTVNASTKSMEVKNLISFFQSLNRSTELFILEKIVKKGFLIADMNFNFDEKGNLEKDFEINGFVKDSKIDIFKKYQVKNLNFIFNLDKENLELKDIQLSLNNIKLLSNKLNLKKIDNEFKISGIIENKNLTLDNKKIDLLIKPYFPDTDIQKVKFSSQNYFSFKLNKKFKPKKFEINSKVSLDELIISNNLKIKNIFPQINETISFTDQDIQIEYKQDNLKIKGSGNFILQKNKDRIDYSIVKINKIYNFDTSIEIKDNPLNIDFLNYKKKKDNNVKIKIKGNKEKDNQTEFNLITLKEKNNKIEIEDLLFDKKFKIIDLKSILVDFLDINNKSNKFTIIKKNKSNYHLNGPSFNADNLIKNLLDDEDDSKILNKNFKISIKIDKLFLDKNYILNNFRGDLFIKNQEIINGNLIGLFSNNKKFRFTVNTMENQKITTLFTDEADTIVSRYKFIKGFKGGKLDFYSSKQNDESVSKIKIYDFRLKELPALTKLLTLASLQGIADLVSGDGIGFEEFEMNFKNKKNVMTIDEIYAIGPAISILMDGYVEKNKLISLRGTLVPATTINKVIGSIPLIGEILVGSKTGEGVFGVSFKIKGPPKNLETTVNPIKTLTPRFITRTLEKIKKN